MYKLALSSLLFCLPLIVQANSKYEDHDAIRDAARQHVLKKSNLFANKPKVKVHRLDRRLTLSKCSTPLQTYDSPNGLKAGRSVVGVRCDGSKPWKIFVSVSIAVEQQVLVSRFPIARGQSLSADNLTIAKRDTAKLHKAYYTNAQSAIGLRAKRSIRAGKVISPNMLAKNQLVKRGAEVEILSRHGALQVRMRGKAMSNGAKGDRIKVKNKTSGREVTGEVISASVILVQE